jgi:hypothetical protein
MEPEEQTEPETITIVIDGKKMEVTAWGLEALLSEVGE